MKRLILLILILLCPCIAGAAATTQGPVFFPDNNTYLANVDASLLAMTATAHKVGFTVQVPKTGNIHKIHFMTSTVTTGDTLVVSLQNPDFGVDYGPPDGTIDQSGTVVVADTDDNKVLSATMGSDRSVTIGDWVSVVIGFNSYVAGSLNIAVASGPATASTAFLYTTSWARQSKGVMCAVEYSDGSISHIVSVTPPGTLAYSSPSSSTDPDEIGIRFVPEFPFSVIGGYFVGRIDADAELKLYNGSTLLATATIDDEVVPDATGGLFPFYFPSVQNLAVGTTYRLTFNQTTTTANRLYTYSAGTGGQNLLNGFPGGNTIYKTQRTDGGSFTDTDTDKPFMGLIIRGFDDGTGSGGGVSTYAY